MTETCKEGTKADQRVAKTAGKDVGNSSPSTSPGVNWKSREAVALRRNNTELIKLARQNQFGLAPRKHHGLI
jgi:hypothetical protein